MNRDNTITLYQNYPELFQGRTRPITESLMGFGPECGDGWCDLIDGLCHDLMALCRKHDWPVPEVVQVKEKLGGLRFYLRSGHPMLFDRIAEAEEASLETCEVCGGAGQIGVRGCYMCVRCTTCAASEDARLSARFSDPAFWRPLDKPEN